MLHIRQGDLLKSDCTVIAHQANCQNTMGAGIALAIKKRYPDAWLADLNSALNPKEKYGRYTMAFGDDKLIFNLYAQFYPGPAATSDEVVERKAAFLTALDNMMEYVAKKKEGIEHVVGPVKIGLPYMIGCGLAGGNWDEYIDIIDKVSDKHNIDIYLYKLA